jgi:hypothetical protein
MPLPEFNIDGLISPFVGADGPGGHFEDLSPYRVSVIELVQGLSFSEGRKSILRGWLLHRRALRAIGFNTGFQWIDGSFVEKDKEPKDIDVVTYFRRPAIARSPTDLSAHLRANLPVFGRSQVKTAFHVDFLYVDLDGTAEVIVNLTRYYAGLFSHRRSDLLWKGMLQVPLEDAGDQDALNFLGPEPIIPGSEAGSTP